MDAHCCKVFRTGLLIPFACRKQGFEWYASSMEAGTTGWTLVNQGYMSSKLRGANSGNIATWTRTDYEYINCRGNVSDYHTFSSF
jgi:hypothetical protein